MDGIALLDVAEFTALPGRGVQGLIHGESYYLGNQRMLEELGQCTTELEQRIAALETAGKTVVMLVGAKGYMPYSPLRTQLRTAAGGLSPSYMLWASKP